MISPRIIAYIDDMDIVAVIRIISLIRFSDGGAAILMAVNMNHHIVIIGIEDSIPFIKNILRV